MAKAKEQALIPEYGDSDWSDYVMSMFREDELEKGLPKANGLRRVMNKLFDVISSTSQQVIMGQDEVAINWTIEFVPHKEIVFDPTNPVYPVRKISGFASASSVNVKYPFNKYLSAIADTRAEARATRKALLLNCIAAEEAEENLDEPVSTDNITNNQKNIIKSMSERNKWSADVLFKIHAKDISDRSPTCLNELTRDEAGKLLNIFNQYQSNSGKTVPVEAKV